MRVPSERQGAEETAQHAECCEALSVDPQHGKLVTRTGGTNMTGSLGLSDRLVGMGDRTHTTSDGNRKINTQKEAIFRFHETCLKGTRWKVSWQDT